MFFGWQTWNSGSGQADKKVGKKLIVIVEPDESYLSALEYKFAEEWGDSAEIEAISSLRYLNVFFEQPRNQYLLLINEYLYSEKIARHECVHTFLLTEEEEKQQEKNGVHMVYKYTGIQEIYGKISRQIEIWKTRRQSSAPGLTVIYPVAGRCGSTLLSLGIAAELAAKEQNVLYLSARSLQDFQIYLKKQDFLPESFCHALAMHEEQVGELLKDVAENEEFSYIPPMQRSSVSYQITGHEYVYLVEKLRDLGYWKEIVLELPDGIDRDTVSLMEMAGHVIVVCRQDRSSVVRLQALRESIAAQDDKYLFVCSCFRPEQENELLSVEGLEIIEYLEEWKEETSLSGLREKGILKNIVYMLE